MIGKQLLKYMKFIFIKFGILITQKERMNAIAFQDQQ